MKYLLPPGVAYRDCAPVVDDRGDDENERRRLHVEGFEYVEDLLRAPGSERLGVIGTMSKSAPTSAPRFGAIDKLGDVSTMMVRALAAARSHCAILGTE